jgi:hypothetical protein
MDLNFRTALGFQSGAKAIEEAEKLVRSVKEVHSIVKLTVYDRDDDIILKEWTDVRPLSIAEKLRRIESDRREALHAAGAEPHRVKRITSHVGLGRYMANDLVGEEGVATIVGEIPRIVRAAYAYSPEHPVFETHAGKKVFIVETSHKRYDVFEVPSKLPITAPR